MKFIRRTIIGISAVALTGALGLPATASAAVASHAGAARALLGGDYQIASDDGGDTIYATGAGDVLLGAAYAGEDDEMQTKAQETYDGHVYYEYEDLNTGLCLQANVSDTFMAEGGCAQVSRQFWFWNGQVLVNRAFNSKACADLPYVDLNINGSGLICEWGIVAY
jgi:hypothetical protein